MVLVPSAPLVAALFVSSPWVAWHLWRFVAGGLHPNERKYVYLFAPATTVLFVAGCLFSYFVLVRYGIRFLIDFGADMGVKPIPSIDSQLMFVLLLSLVMGVIFQLPLVMLVLVVIAVIYTQTYVKKRKLFVIIAFIIAAIITPTQDAINLALATAPMLLLYEIGIWICRIAERRRAARLAG